jgi:hypothetical protein
MTDGFAIALFASIPPTLTALAGLIVSLRNAKRIEEVHVATDGMKDALVAGAGREGHAKGVKDEKHRAKIVEEKSRSGRILPPP